MHARIYRRTLPVTSNATDERHFSEGRDTGEGHDRGNMLERRRTSIRCVYGAAALVAIFLQPQPCVAARKRRQRRSSTDTKTVHTPTNTDSKIWGPLESPLRELLQQLEPGSIANSLPESPLDVARILAAAKPPPTARRLQSIRSPLQVLVDTWRRAEQRYQSGMDASDAIKAGWLKIAVQALRLLEHVAKECATCDNRIVCACDL